MIRTKELGRHLVDSGDVVSFSIDELDRLAEKLGIETDTLIERYKGVKCEFGSDGTYGVDEVVAVHKDGRTTTAVLIGSDPENVVRFLRTDEPMWGEFYRAHPKHASVKSGEIGFNQVVFDEIVQDYAKLILS